MWIKDQYTDQDYTLEDIKNQSPQDGPGQRQERIQCQKGTERLSKQPQVKNEGPEAGCEG